MEKSILIGIFIAIIIPVVVFLIYHLGYYEKIQPIPSKFIIRNGYTNWKELIENGDQTDTNIQGWNPDSQIFDTNFPPPNEIAKQFRYFAEYWLNRSGRNEGSVNVYTFGMTYQGVYTFRKVTGYFRTVYYGSFYGYNWWWCWPEFLCP